MRGYGHQADFRRMFELKVASLCSGNEPPVVLQKLDDFSRFHFVGPGRLFRGGKCFGGDVPAVDGHGGAGRDGGGGFDAE